MRKVIIGMLMAATAATPVLAQDNEWRGRGQRDGQAAEQRSEARAERQQERQQQREVRTEQRVERQAEQRTEQRVERQGGYDRNQAAAEQQIRVQQQQAQGRRSERDRAGGTWQRRGADAQVQVQQEQVRTDTRQYRGDRDASRFAAERAASQRSAEQTIGGNYARRAYENERRYEQQQLSRENRRDGRYDRDGRNRQGGYNRDGRDHRDWNRNWRSDNRYDWQRYRYQNRNIFNPGRYYAPYRGYSYNRLSIGLVLDQLFFGRDYWIDPGYYHLPAAPYGTQWVRYYDDIVLVDVYNGEVLDVIYDFFW